MSQVVQEAQPGTLHLGELDRTPDSRPPGLGRLNEALASPAVAVALSQGVPGAVAGQVPVTGLREGTSLPC